MSFEAKSSSKMLEVIESAATSLDEGVVVNLLHPCNEAEEDWEDRMDELEKQERREVREHISRLAQFPDCCALALQCELERLRQVNESRSIQRDLRKRMRRFGDNDDDGNANSSAPSQTAKIIRILSFTAVIVTGVVLASSLYLDSRPTPSESKPRCAGTPPKVPVQQSEPTPVVRTETTYRYLDHLPPQDNASRRCHRGDNHHSTSETSEYRYVIVREKVERQ